MMQNLRYYCKERIEALADKQCKFGCIYIYTKLGLNILFRVQIKYHIIHLQIWKDTEIYKEPLYIFFYYMKEMSEFCKSVKLSRFIN